MLIQIFLSISNYEDNVLISVDCSSFYVIVFSCLTFEILQLGPRCCCYYYKLEWKLNWVGSSFLYKTIKGRKPIC